MRQRTYSNYYETRAEVVGKLSNSLRESIQLSYWLQHCQHRPDGVRGPRQLTRVRAHVRSGPALCGRVGENSQLERRAPPGLEDVWFSIRRMRVAGVAEDVCWFSAFVRPSHKKRDKAICRGVAIVFVADINVDPEAFAVSGRARILYAHLHTLKRC